MKKSKKNRKKQNTDINNLKPAQLISSGKTYLSNNNARMAIDYLKLASKKQGLNEELKELLFKAYTIRADELRKKNLLVEAEALSNHALDYLPSLNKISEDDLCIYLSKVSDKMAIDAYREYLKHNKRSLKIEQKISYFLLLKQNFAILDILDISNPLRINAELMKNALNLMNDGKWEDALVNMKSISRTSPYSAIRMFCYSMVLFYQNEDKKMAIILSKIPDDFPLIKIAKGLINYTNTNILNNTKQKYISDISCLFDIPENFNQLIDEIVSISRQYKIKKIRNHLIEFAKYLLPNDSQEDVIFYLISLWWHDFSIDDVYFKHITKIAYELLPDKKVDLLIAKIEFNKFKYPLKNTGDLLQLLIYKYKVIKQLNIASAMVLVKAVDLIHSYQMNIDMNNFFKYSEILGINSRNYECILIDMLNTAIKLDQKNYNSYQLLVKLKRKSKSAKNTVEKLLLIMKTAFKDDPLPCLELATIYYEKNAYRKAELILEEAIKRAPHDNKVIDRRTLSLLISAQKNFNRKKMHLVSIDMEKAKKLESKKLVPFILEKEILLSIMDDPEKLVSIIEDKISELPLNERIRIIAILFLDLTSYYLKGLNVKKLEKIFDSNLQKIEELSSQEIIKLLSPLEKEYLWILPSTRITQAFQNKWDFIYKSIDESDIFMLFDIMLNDHLFDTVLKEINKRKKRSNESQMLKYRFYEITINHIIGKYIKPDLFFDIIDNADMATIDSLKTESRRLSKHAYGPLKMALEKFDFEILMFNFGFMNFIDEIEFDDF